MRYFHEIRIIIIKVIIIRIIISESVNWEKLLLLMPYIFIIWRQTEFI